MEDIIMKRSSLFIIPLFLLALNVQAAETATTWQLDKAHSDIGFWVKHLGVSKVKGNFKQFDAVIEAGADGKITSVSADTIVDSIDTGIEKRDGHLKSPDFFDSAKFPKITLKSKKITWSGNNVSVETDFTMKGVTRTVVFTGEFLGAQKADFGQGAQLHAGYSLKGKLNRQDFGLAFNMLAEGTAIVGDEINLEIEVEIVQAIGK